MLGLLLFFCVLFFFTVRIYKKKGITPSFFLYFLYALSGFVSLILVLFYDGGNNPYIKDYNSGAIYLLFALMLYLQPFAEINDDKIKYVTVLKSDFFKVVIYVLTFLSFYSIIYFMPIVKKMLFVDVSDVASLRNLVAIGENPYITESLFNTIAGTAAHFYVLQILFFFLMLLEYRKITFLSILVLLSSFSYPMFVLAYMGRDGVLFWFISFLCYYLLFSKYIPFIINKKIKKLVFVLFVPFVCSFLFVTIGRFLFGESIGGIGDVLYPVLSYLGQGPINFSELYYTDIRKMGYGKNILTLFFNNVNNDTMFLAENYGVFGWVFKTFVSSIYLDFGSILTLLIAVILLFMFRAFYYTDKKKKCFSFSFLIMYSLFFTIYSQGVFYFRQYNRVGNLFILTMLLFSFVTLFLPKKKIIL